MSDFVDSTKYYRAFTEYNEHEGETWTFYIPVENNEIEIEELQNLCENDRRYEVGDEYTENEVDILVRHARGDYMSDRQKLKGRLTAPKNIDHLYKGGIRYYMKNC